MHELSFVTSIALVITFLFFGSIDATLAQIRQSTNYHIQSDSINIGGGLSNSTNYGLESTAGEVGTGESNSVTYALKAGYQQMHEVFISITDVGTVSLSPSIPGVTGGTANGSTTLTVVTDSPSGYSLTVAASLSPAMQSGANTIANYNTAGDPDFAFGVGSTDALFGYSPSGVDILSRFLDNGSVCNVGSSDTSSACWEGVSTTPAVIARSLNSNQPLGATTTLYFRVGVGNNVSQASGSYTATVTVTALPL